MAEPAVAFLLDQVKEAVREYKDLISGAENEFYQLNKELGFLKAFLKDAAKKSKQENLFKELERQIRDVVYEVEDTIDTCLTKATEAKAKASRKPSFFSTKRYSLAKEVRSIREDKVVPMFNDAKLKFATMQINDGSGGIEDQRTKLKRTKPIRHNRVVGFDVEEEIITGYLMQEKERLDVISIVGIPGQGKTTLAWKVYQNETISFNFPICIWVYISQKFNSRDVFLQILKKFAPSLDASKMEYDDLAQTVRACLEKDKFLLVLDDVWSVEAWEEIKGVLPLNNGKGKVVITTREMKVATRSSTIKPHELKFLDENESWMLLQYEVYDNLEECPQELRGMGQNLANKCDGVPLTIVVIGGILLDQLAVSPSPAVAMKEWAKMAENMSSALQNVEGITDVVALSYERMPDDLRDCFVYIGVFPEDYEIPVKMLSELWIAEGFIHPKEGRSLEQSAQENVNDLICRNLLKVDETNYMGRVKTCRVHDVIRAFCITKSRHDKLFQQIKISKETGVFEPPISEVENFHRLCFQSDLSKFLSESPSAQHVRSFLCFYEQAVELEPHYISVIPDGFPKLRILESRSVKFHQFPGKVTKLIHLRYLTLRIDNLTTLPKQIALLWNLQALVVETKKSSITMEANMWKMIWLRQIKTKAAITLNSSEWDGEAGQNLQTLDRLSPTSCTEAVSERAKNLRTLGISGKLANIFETKFLEKFLQLEKLKLVNSSTFETASEDLLHRLPQSNSFPPYLKRLTLIKTSLDWQNMSVLAMIRTLEVLKLKDKALVGASWNVTGYSFPNLQLLLIANTDLVIWDASTGSFPSLRFLVLHSCEDLMEIPQCLGTHLEKLDIKRLRKTAVESARAIHETRKGKSHGKFAVPFNLTLCPSCEKM